MPCYSEYSEPNYAEMAKQRELNAVTRLLCSTLRDLRKHDRGAYERLMESNSELRLWWIKHQKFDRDRRDRELREAKNEVIRYFNEQQALAAKMERAQKKLERLRR